MLLAAGLGNPGPEYRDTRHNVGFKVVDRVAKNTRIPMKRRSFRAAWGLGRYRGQKLALCQPLTYMNRSGLSVVALMASLDLEPGQLLVIYDDLDLPVGKLRLRARGGSGGHRGLDSIIQGLGTQEFPRLRVGIGHPPPEVPPAEYVLSPFSEEEDPLVEAALAEAAQGVEMMLDQGLDPAMNRINAWQPPSETGGEDSEKSL